MDHKFDFSPNAKTAIVYVRPVCVATLAPEIQALSGGAARLYAVCTSEGQQLALVNDRKLAFILARQHDYTPVNVH